MERYFLHIENGSGLQRDETGAVFSSPAIALGEAAATAGEVLRDHAHNRPENCRVTVTVEAEGGAPIGEVVATLSLAT